MIKHLLVILPLIMPAWCHGQSYVDSPFYKPIAAIPSSAHVEAYSHGSIKANDIVIDLSWVSVPHVNLFGDGGGEIAADVDRNGAAKVFRFYIQYNALNVTFGYDMLAQPEGADKIKCIFSTLTDPTPLWWQRDKSIPVVPLPADLTPLVIKSGDAIAIRTTFPHGESKAEVIHYLRLTRLDLPSTTAGEDETSH